MRGGDLLRSRRAVLALAVLVAVAVAAVVVLRARNTDDRPSSTPVRSLVDDFSDDGRLGVDALPDGLPWTVDGGTFAEHDGFVSATVNSGQPAFALLALDRAPELVTVLFSRAAVGCGVAFRFVDGANFWSIEADPDFGTWNLFRTQAGSKQFVANTGNTLSAENTTIALHQSADQIEIDVEGRVAATVRDPAMQGASRLGLIAATSEGAATRWSRFEATGAELK